MQATSNNNFDDAYLDFIVKILHHGTSKTDRTGTGTRSIFGHQMRFDLSEGFPLITVKKTLWKPIVHELLWFLKGDTNVRYLKEHGVNIWDSWVKEGTAEYRPMTDEEIVKEISTHFGSRAKFWQRGAFERDGKVGYEYMMYNETLEDGVGVPCSPGTSLEELYEETFQRQPKKLTAGELGPVYGAQWRSWPDTAVVENDSVDDLVAKGYEDLGPIDSAIDGKDYCQHSIVRGTIDQIAKLIEMLKNNPDSRRLIVSAWNPALVDEMALPPCHALFQFYTAPLSHSDRQKWCEENKPEECGYAIHDLELQAKFFDDLGAPKYRLSCQLYQRKSNCAFVA